MRKLDFAYVGLGVHEEVVYSVAAELGYYADEGVRVAIRDGALGALLDDPALGAEHVGRLLPADDADSARDFYDRYVGPHFRAHGQPDPDVVARALALVADELRITTGHAVDVPPAEEIYRSELTAAWAP